MRQLGASILIVAIALMRVTELVLVLPDITSSSRCVAFGANLFLDATANNISPATPESRR